ncbi:MAG: hypothetical protein WC570_02155 [Patescibacteria group bacterium]
MENKICKQCNADFAVADEDLVFYQKVALEFGGKKYPIPVPEICPDCREQRRIGWRNENKLYKRKCHLCQSEIVSIYSPDKDYMVCCAKCFWSDKWDAIDQGREFDFSRTFFEQFDELLHDTKLINLFGSNNENSDYVNQETDDKNCYLCFGGHYNENCYYNTYSIWGKNNIDNYWVWNSERLYECIDTWKSNSCSYLINCEDCFDCHFGYNLVGCKNCFGSVNLHHQEYYFFNEKLGKEEHEKRVREYMISSDGIEKAKNDYYKHSLRYPRRFAKLKNCENCTGDMLQDCKNVKDSNLVWQSENSKYLNIAGGKDCWDCSSNAWTELNYNIASSIKSSRSVCSSHLAESPDSIYCFTSFNSSNLFGCAGLIRKQYCILNKQYTKEEYEKLMPRIIEHMQQSGEWGQFFPLDISPFGYNETVAMEYYPITKEVAINNRFKWQDIDYGIQYNGPFYEPKDIKEYDPTQNPNAEAEIEECKKGILKCEVTGKPYRILPQELAAYIERGIQIPRQHPDQRHIQRLGKLNPRKLWHRQCMCREDGHGHDEQCNNEFETTYAPERSEIIYCEECYQKSIL